MSSNQTYLDQATPVGLHPAVRFLIFAAVVVFIPSVVISTALIFGRIRLDKHIAEIRASGEPTNAQELAEKFPPIPDERNAAILLYKASTHYKPLLIKREGGETQPSPSSGVLIEGVVHRRRAVSKGAQSGQAETTHDPSNRPSPFMPLDPEYKEFAKELLALNSECLVLMHEAAQRPECRSLLDQKSSGNNFFSLFQYKIALEADDGNIDAVFQDLMDEIKLEMLLRQDQLPFYYSEGTFGAIQRNPFSDLQIALPRCILRPDQLKTLEEALHGLAKLYLRCQSLLGERYQYLEGYSRSRLDQPGKNLNLKEVIRKVSTYYNRGALSEQYDNPFRVDRQLSVFDEQIEILRKAPEEQEIAIETFKNKLEDTPLLFMSASVVDIQYTNIANEVYSAITRTAIALYRYHLDKNAWPADLNELVPQYLAAIPRDPFAPLPGTPVRYINGPSGVRVYSVGGDREDNGGLTRQERVNEPESANLFADRKPKRGDDVAFMLQPPAK